MEPCVCGGLLTSINTEPLRFVCHNKLCHMFGSGITQWRGPIREPTKQEAAAMFTVLAARDAAKGDDVEVSIVEAYTMMLSTMGESSK